MEQLPLVSRAISHGDAIAVRSGSQVHSYREILDRSEAIAAALLGTRKDLQEARIAYRIPAGFDHIAVQWGIWQAGGVAVPLCLLATDRELEQTLRDSQSECVIANQELAARGHRWNLRTLVTEEIAEPSASALPVIDPARRAMILYTSGTTSQPKGVVSTHACIQAQIESLVEAWRWEPNDRIPLFLPLHHIHGIVNVMLCALWAGAQIEPFPRFDRDAILRRVAEGAYTVFMAVPTIYVQLIEALECLPDDLRTPILGGFRPMRLMVSGSAALPATVHKRWAELTGQPLLERYGMTEIGMALSNPYNGERRPGTVGQPLPGVEIRLKAEHGNVVSAERESGEILVRGPNVFLEYWNRPEATRESFEDGWFRTGDIAVVENAYYRILGRSSVDIIKSGGYKLSALEIEAVLLEHPAIAECAVVGVPNETWGEVVAAAVVLKGDLALELEQLQSWCRDRLSSYKIPRQLQIVDRLPRNVMGKISKPAVLELFREHADMT